MNRQWRNWAYSWPTWTAGFEPSCGDSGISEEVIGSLLYFFEKACGISGYLLGVNPFDQPGVEAYKKNMFALLEKPGYEEATKAIKARL